MFSNFNVAKCETQVRLCHARIKLQKNKRTIAIKQMRKEVADLLRTGKQEYARIRVEGVIRENLLMQAYEILELYLELIAVRVQLIAKSKEIPRDMVEAVSSIIYAAQRVSDIPELAALRGVFATKYGKEYVADAGSDTGCVRWQVNANLMRCLMVEPPQGEDKLAMLSEIAQEHGVEWDLSSASRDLLPPGSTVPHHLMNTGNNNNDNRGQPPPSNRPPGPGNGQLAVPDAYNMQGMSPQQAAAAAEQAAAHARASANRAAELAALHAELQGIPGALPPQQPPPLQQQGYAPPPQRPAGAPSGMGTPAVRTNEDIQRAYDAAIGPPTKGAIQPSGPPMPMNGNGMTTNAFPSVPTPLPDAPRRDADPNIPNLPRPPQGIPGVSTGMEDEYDELTKRLDALKKS